MRSKVIKKKKRGTTASRKKRKSVVPKLPHELPQDLESLIKLIERSWPAPKSKDVARLFSAVRKATGQEPLPAATREAPPSAAQSVDLLEMLRRTLSSHDLLFLRRRITYHIAASAALPRVFVDADRVQTATASLLEYMATRAPRGSRIGVKLNEIALRSGKGVEVVFAGTDNTLSTIDKTAFLQRMYEAESSEGVVLITCRELVASQGGQMWADLPRPKQPIFHMILPSSPEAVKLATRPQRMFKYDIAISNYANVRKRFGIKKSLSLVGEIEMYVRALVRHPIDIVTAVREKGVITTIYESPTGAAQSVASRISQRLGSEEFRIGKKPVDLVFRYNLSQLPSGITQMASIDKGS